jgi:hypothetical protein
MSPIRVGLLAGAACVTSTSFGQTLPSTPPTAAVPLTAPTPQAVQAQPRQANRAQVELKDGMISVKADNSSLNQILRDISRLTGMKISGGVTDERVFGTYGPADPSTVLSTLLGGTGSNMMIVLDARRAPQELVLTPRGGGPSPPNPSASRDRGEEDVPQQMGPRYGRPAGIGAFPPENQAPPPQTPTQLAPQMAPQAPTTPPSGDTTTQESPNGVKTPQQIYDQLVKMQQQQQQPKDE